MQFFSSITVEMAFLHSKGFISVAVVLSLFYYSYILKKSNPTVETTLRDFLGGSMRVGENIFFYTGGN